MAKQILVVDGNVNVRETTRTLLVSRGYVVHTEMTAQAAIAFLGECEGGIDVVVTAGMLMDGSTGLRLVRDLKARWPKLRVIFMSGASVEEEALTAGADAFIAKPFAVERLIALIESASLAAYP